MGNEFFSFQTYRSFFDGSDYPFWKYKIKFYLDSDPIKLCDVILDGWNPPMKIIEGIQVVKEINEWS